MGRRPSVRRKIRVLHAITNLKTGGAEMLVKNILLGLNPEKFEKMLFVFENEGELLADVKAAGVKVFTREVGIRRFNPLIALNFFKLVRRERIDIIHTHLYKCNLYGRVGAWLAGARVIIAHEHGGILRKPFLHRIANTALQLISDKLVFVSKHDLEYFARNEFLHVDKCIVMYNGCSPAPINRMRVSESQDRPVTLVSVGQLNKAKGHIFLLRAIKHLQDNATNNIQVRIVGEGAERDNLELYIRNNDLKNVQLPGNLAQAQQLIADADIFIHPSISEGFGIAIIEAFAAGLPVIASQVGGIPETVINEENGLLVPPGDARELASAILRLVDDQELRHKLGQKAYQSFAERFTIDDYLRKLEALYFSQYLKKT